MTNTVEIYIEREAFYDIQNEFLKENPRHQAITYSQFCEKGNHIRRYAL